ncbi:MAG TPA: hypothetical protein VMH41_03515 [Mycobacteriales bacterium]|nr:hypothetical protein [Mycobacteriales bacterium]
MKAKKQPPCLDYAGIIGHRFAVVKWSRSDPDSTRTIGETDDLEQAKRWMHENVGGAFKIDVYQKGDSGWRLVTSAMTP